jgi:hypothetical protein
MAILVPTAAAVWGEGGLGGLGVAGGGVLLTRPPGNRMTKADASMLSNKILEAYLITNGVLSLSVPCMEGRTVSLVIELAGPGKSLVERRRW